jgi:CHAD domain-containing protein
VQTRRGRPPAPPPRPARRAPAKGLVAALEPALTIAQACARVMLANLAHLRANEAGFLRERDPEYLHQMRVSLRRLRSALAVFAPAIPDARRAVVATEAEWLSQRLGAARDWDVYVQAQLTALRAAYPRHAGLAQYANAMAALHRRAREAAQAAVRSPRYRRLVLAFAALADGSEDTTSTRQRLRAFARAALERRHARMMRRGRRFASRSAPELHRLRIAVKKLRYAAQFFSTLYDARAQRELLDALARLQNVLGALNDSAVTAHLVAQARPRGDAAELAEAHGLLLACSEGRKALRADEAKRCWAAVRRAPVYW